ncbi:hypothetical protein [Agrobacterium arsenijevicii]
MRLALLIWFVVLFSLIMVADAFFQDPNDPFVKSMISEGCMHPVSWIFQVVSFGIPLVVGIVAVLQSIIKSQE